MAEKTEQVDVDAEEVGAPPGPSHSIGELLHRLARSSERAEGRTRFFRNALLEIASFFGSPYAALEFSAADQLIRAEERDDGPHADQWRDALQELLSESLASDGRARFQIIEARDRGVSASLMAAPVFDDEGNTRGAVVCATQVVDRNDARFRLAQLERLAIFLTIFASKAHVEIESHEQGSDSQAALIAQASAFRSPTEFAFSITNGLRARTGCDVVALGVVRSRRIKVISISGADDVNQKSPGVHAMTSAMEECLDAKESVVWPQCADWLDDGDPAIYGLHRQWSEAAGGAAVASLPLCDDSGVVAVLALRRPTGEFFDPDFIGKIAAAAQGYAPALKLVKAARRSWLSHSFSSLLGFLRDFGRPGRWPLQLLRVGLVALAIWVAVGTLPYDVSSPAKLVRPDRHSLGAPMPSILAEVRVRPGDQVRKGDILAVLDTRALELERDRAVAELKVAEVEAGRALADGVAVELRMAQARRDSLKAALSVLENRIAAATLRAPIDGIVLEGDLKARVGDTFAQGEPLFELAPENDWLVEIEVDESDAALIEGALEGEFASRAHPERSHRFKIARQRPRTEARKGRNVVILEAPCEIDAAWLRSGMEGRAVIESGRHRVWWIVSRQAVDWLRLNLWL